MDPYQQQYGYGMPQGYVPGNNMGAGAQGTYAAPPIAYMVPPQMGQYMAPPHQMMPPNMQTHHHSGFAYGPPAGAMPPMQPPMRSYNPTASNITVLPPNSSHGSITISSQPTPSRPIGRLVTLFIGAIPEGISDENIEAVLKCCGTCDQWKRLKSPDGTPKKFGLADFTDPEALLLAWRVLNNPERPVVIPVLPGSDQEPKPLTLKLEDDAQYYLTQYQRDRKIDKEQDVEIENEVFSKVMAVVDSIYNSVKKSTRKASPEEEGHRSSSKRIRNSHDREESEEDDEDDDKVSEASLIRFKEQEDSRVRQRSAEFHDRLKQWEDREIYRSKIHERNQLRDLELEERRALDREEHAARFQEWDDDKERELGREDYYKDRARWWDRRQSIRQRELEADEVDRERVRQEAEIELKRIKEVEARNIELGLMPDEDKYLGPGKVKFSLAPSSNSLVRRRPLAPLSNAAANEDDEEAADAAKRAKRVLVPLDYSDTEEGEMRHSKYSRTERLRSLMESIPAARDNLFEWKIKWKFLDENALSKVRSFAEKKILEYLGVQEPALLKFVMGHLKTHQPPQALVEELEKALDEEGATFVMKLWRMIIFETEANALGLR
ncbi:hypothetical protein DSO57_1018219 [Entomophthora muscae]|uniref:Uncharacterized protein n=1 Tax=Entomophthora muscae TaxID=34485 RepID=A0ACC2RVG1_9FUNG|nr:hypothetical protein DSO57_1018219 [Entomophthora muscae]